MRIDFFEEYPTPANLEPAAALRGPSTIYLASPDLGAFRARADHLREVNPRLEPAYWPLLPRSYWVYISANARRE